MPPSGVLDTRTGSKEPEGSTGWPCCSRTKSAPGGVRYSQFEFVLVQFHPAGDQEDLPQPGDEGSHTLGDKAVLQHI